MTTHARARELAREALESIFPHEDITEDEVRVLAGIACLETSYGNGWKGAGKGSNNMGAIQAGYSWRGETFTYTDTHPNADGSSTPYRIKFRKYDTPLDGWKDLVQVAYINRRRASVRRAAQLGDLHAVSAAMHSTGYYEGFGKTVAERIANHCKALTRCVKSADQSTNPINEIPVSPEPRLLQFGRPLLRGDDVKEWQEFLQSHDIDCGPIDGVFGRLTSRATKVFQNRAGLKPDGIVGPITRAAMETTERAGKARLR